MTWGLVRGTLRNLERSWLIPDTVPPKSGFHHRPGARLAALPCRCKAALKIGIHISSLTRAEQAFAVKTSTSATGCFGP